MRSHAYATRYLKLVARAEDFQKPGARALAVGDRVRLNSGGPSGLVVDEMGDDLTVAWKYRGIVSEHNLSRGCLHKYPQGSR